MFFAQSYMGSTQVQIEPVDSGEVQNVFDPYNTLIYSTVYVNKGLKLRMNFSAGTGALVNIATMLLLCWIMLLPFLRRLRTFLNRIHAPLNSKARHQIFFSSRRCCSEKIVTFTPRPGHFPPRGANSPFGGWTIIDA